MNKLKLIVLITYLTCLSISIHAQDYSKKYKVITHGELDMTSYEKDKNAEAIVLFDIGESEFIDSQQGGFNIRFTRTKRIKILKKAGIEDASEISIPFYVDGYGKTESIQSIEAITYNKTDGILYKKDLNASNIFEEKISNNWKAKKFTFPDVKEGSILEFRYVLETPFVFNLPDWYFQESIPVIHSEYTLKLIPFYEYVFIAQSIKKFDYKGSQQDTKRRAYAGVPYYDVIHKYIMKDIPAFKNEAFITSKNDYLQKLDFQLSKFHRPSGYSEEVISTWPKLIESHLKHDDYGKFIKGSNSIAKKVLQNDLDLTGKSKLEKCKLIIEYVKKQFTWNGINSRYASKNAKSFFKQKNGNATEINLFLIGMLRAAEIKADPVLISTRNHGKVSIEYPFEHFFNYSLVFVKLDNTAFLTDATEELIAFDRIPPRCINERGLIVSKEQANWVKLESPSISQENKTLNINIDPEELTATALISMQTTEFDAYDYKYSFSDDENKLKEFFKAKGLSDINKIKTINYKKIGKPYIIATQGNLELEQIGDKIIVSPFLNFPVNTNVLTEAKRNYPLDFIYPTQQTYNSKIIIPDGYKLANIPEGYEMDNQLAAIHVTFDETNGVINANATYTFKKSIYQPEDYSKIKSYFNVIVDKFNQQIVLEEE